MMVKSVETFHINIPDHYKDTAFRGHSSESACWYVYAGSITTSMQEDCMLSRHSLSRHWDLDTQGPDTT